MIIKEPNESLYECTLLHVLFGRLSSLKGITLMIHTFIRSYCDITSYASVKPVADSLPGLMIVDQTIFS